MKIVILASFRKDVLRIREKGVLRNLDKMFDRLENAETLNDIPNVKSLKGFQDYYRIGFKYDGNVLTLIRFLHRKNIYRHFP